MPSNKQTKPKPELQLLICIFPTSLLHALPSWLGLYNTLTASLQRGKPPHYKCPEYETKQSDGCNIHIGPKIYDQDTNTWNVHRESRNTRNWFRYETFYELFEFKVFRHERERHNFFLCWLSYIGSSRLTDSTNAQHIS